MEEMRGRAVGRLMRTAGCLGLVVCLSGIGDAASETARALATGPEAKEPAGATTPGPPTPRSDAGIAEVKLPAPAPYALLRHPDGRGTLHGAGEAVFHPSEPTRSFVVGKVAPDRLALRETMTNRQHAIGKGQVLPGFAGVTFVDAVLVDHLEYRYRTVETAPRPDPSLVALDGSRAVLEVEVPRRAVAPNPVHASGSFGDWSPVRTPIDTLSLIPVERVDATTYEIRAGYREAIDWATSQVQSAIRPSFFLEGGPGLSIATEVAEGTLNGRGFVVTAPKLAARVGLEVGDVIRRVNGQTVDGIGSAIQVVQQARTNPRLTAIQVELERRGQPLTMTYRLK